MKLSDYRGKRVVLFFYPKANTPGCTREACAFRDEAAAFKRKRVAILGISRDKPETQRKFKEKNGLPFPLLSDPDAEVEKAFGVFKEKTMYGRKVLGTERTTVIVDKDGVVEQIFSKVKVEGHVASVLEEL